MVSGLEIDLWELPKQNFEPSPLFFSNEESVATDKLLEQLVLKNAIVPCGREKGDFVSTIFLRRKPNGSYCLILNLRNFNKYVDFCRFKMESLQKILTLVTHECFMGSIDLTDAYLTVYITFLFSKFLKFQWRGQYFKFVAMPFGLTEAPRKFTKLLKPPLAVVRQAGYMILTYLDDFFQCEQCKRLCQEAIIYAYNLLVTLGFIPNLEKSVLVPTQRLEALGHIIDSVSMIVSLPANKSEAIVNMLIEALQHPTFTIRHLCTIIGKLISCWTVHPMGRLHYRSLERLKLSML